MKTKLTLAAIVFLLSATSTYLWLDNRRLERAFHEATQGWAECATKSLFVRLNVEQKGGEKDER